MKAGRRHQTSGAENADHLEHVVVLGAENCRPAELFGNTVTRAGVELLGCNQSNEHPMPLTECINSFSDSSQISLKRGINILTAFMKIERAIVAPLVCTGYRVRCILCK